MANRDHVLQVRITSDGLAAIDERRGQWSRSEFVREALKLAMRKGLNGPKVKG